MMRDPTEDALRTASERRMHVTAGSRSAIVRRPRGHPSCYVYITPEGTADEYFLGVVVPGMTRGVVRRLAIAWLKERG